MISASEENNGQWYDEDFLDGVPCIMSESLISEQLFKVGALSSAFSKHKQRSHNIIVHSKLS